MKRTRQQDVRDMSYKLHPDWQPLESDPNQGAPGLRAWIAYFCLLALAGFAGYALFEAIMRHGVGR